MADQPQGFLAEQATATGPGVLVLHAWWGLNDTIKTFCQRLADAGFIVFAPDLYDGKVADTIPGATALRATLNTRSAQDRVGQATTFLHERVGRGNGGLAVVVFYGSGYADHKASRATYLGHFAENDPFEPLADVAVQKHDVAPGGLVIHPGCRQRLRASPLTAAPDLNLPPFTRLPRLQTEVPMMICGAPYRLATGP